MPLIKIEQNPWLSGMPPNDGATNDSPWLQGMPPTEEPSALGKAWEAAKQQYPLAGILNAGKVMESLYEKLDNAVGTPRSPYATEPPTPSENLYELTTAGDPRLKIGNLLLRTGVRMAGGTAAMLPQLVASVIDPQSQGADTRTQAAGDVIGGMGKSIASVLPNAWDLSARSFGMDDPSSILPESWQQPYQELITESYKDPALPATGVLLAEGGVKMGKAGVGKIKDIREAKQAAIMRDRFAREEAIKRQALEERLAERAAEETAMSQIEDMANAGPVGQRVGMRPAHEPQTIESGTPFTQPETPVTGGMKPMPRDNVLAPRTGDPTLDLAISSGAPKTDLPAYDSPGIGQPRANVVQNPRSGGIPVSLDVRPKAQPIFGSTANPTSPKMQVRMSRGVSTAKQPWEMTFPEFAKRSIKDDVNPEIVQDGWVHQVTKALEEGKPVSREILESNSDIYWNDKQPMNKWWSPANLVGNRRNIEQALREGKPVPSEVLSEFPDLAKKYGVSEISPTVPKTDPVASVQGGGKYQFNVGDKTDVGYIRAQVTSTDGRIGYIISDKPEGIARAISQDDLIRSIDIEQKNRVSAAKQAEQARIASEAKAKRDDLKGFTDSMDPMARGRNTSLLLNQEIRHRGQVMRRKEFIESLSGEGYVAKSRNGKYIAESPDGSFFDIRKVDHDYLNHLNTKPMSGKLPTIPDTPPSPVGKAKRGGGLDATIVPVAGAGLGAAAIYSALSDEDKNFVKAGISEGSSGLFMMGLTTAMLVGGKKPSEYLKAKGIKAPSGGSFRPTMEAVSTAVGGDVLMGMRQVQTPLSGSESVVRAKNTVGEVVKNFTPAIYSIDKLGKGAKELFYDPVVSGLNVVTREAKPAQLAFRSLLKEAGIGIRNYGDVSKKIATFAIAQQKNGIEILKGMGITEIPKLTPQELTVYKYMRQQYEALHPRLNQARKAAGLREIGYTDDYFTFARNMEDWLQSGQAIDGGKLFIEGQETIPLADQTAAAFTKSRGTSTAQLQLDAFGTFESYLNSAARHIHLTPLLAEQARMLTKNYGTAKNPWYLKDENPGAYMELRDWINQQAGYQLPQRSQILSGAVSRFTQRMVRAGLSFNVQSMVIQPTAYANFVAQHGAKWGAEGAKVLFDEKLRQMVMDKSRVLYGREHDISVTRGREGQIGVLGRVAEKVGDVGMNPLQKLDLLTAEATWYGAYQKALKEMKLPENKAIIYADDIVTKTQGSASTADIAPIQRTPWGKALTAYNTFTINNINWLARELPGNGSKLSQTGRVGRYLLGTMLINYAYEQAGFNSPVPNPISAFASAMGDDKENPFQESLKETIGMFPVVGGASQYGSSSLGATSQLLDDMIGVGTGQKGARATVQTAGKLLGIPGTTQAAKLLFPYNEKK